MTVGGARQLLLVEDNPGDADLIGELVEEAPGGDHVARVETLGAAIAALHEKPYDAILLDLRLPDASGVECVVAIRKVAEAIPIVVLTGMDDEALALSCLRSGAQDYFSKLELRSSSLRRAIDYAIVRMEEGAQRARADALQARLAAIVDAASDAIVSASLDGALTSWNPAAERIFGVSRAEAIGQPASAVLPFIAEFAASLAGHASPVGPHERLWRRADGQVVTLSVVASTLLNGSRTPVGFAYTCRDISTQRAFETQLALADRMVSIGTLAAGVAHEINNPLAAVVANLELANQQLAALGPLAAPLQAVSAELRDAEDAALRVLGIASDLKRLSRPGDDTTGPVDLGRAIASALRIAAVELRHRARIVEALAPVPMVEANEARLGQVLLNLFVNAAQAIQPGHPDQNEVRVETGVDPQGRVTVRVTDTGAGIPVEARGRIFSAFFTTKPAGVGTGLGLAISRELVTSFGGEIWFESEVGRGTSFVVALRASAGRAALPPTPVAEAAPPPPRRARVLIIDDEPALLRVLSRILGESHEVTTTLSAVEGLAWLKAGQRFDLVMCDLMMPAMSGAAFYEAAAPLLERVIFMSGGAVTAEARALLENTAHRHLEKPFNADRVRAVVNEVLT